MSTTITRPPLRYHGGKWRLGEWIVSHFPAHRVYVEPFGGGASVLLRKRRAYAEVLNDLDGEVVNFFRVLRDEPAELARAVALTPFSRAEFDGAYEPAADDLEQARRTVIRSHMGFGSAAVSLAHRTGFRSNVTRSGTVPAKDWAKLPAVLSAVAERLRGVTIERDDAAAVVARYDGPETLHYCDPPYVWETRRPGAGPWQDAYRHEMDDDAHRALAAVLRAAEGMVVLSGYPCPLYDLELYPDWHRLTSTANGQQGGVARTEVLWLNPAAARALPQRSLFE
jgi:DNA adenine methylase